MTINTAHYKDEDKTTCGYVYLVVRDDGMSVKIGSSVYSPRNRFHSSRDCHPDGFVLAIYTTAVRQLEYFLHQCYADIKLRGSNNFGFETDDICGLVDWVQNGTFTFDDVTYPMKLADLDGVLIGDGYVDSFVGKALRRIDQAVQARPVAVVTRAPRERGASSRKGLKGGMKRHTVVVHDDWLALVSRMTDELGITAMDAWRYLFWLGVRDYQAGERPELERRPRAMNKVAGLE